PTRPPRLHTTLPTRTLFRSIRSIYIEGQLHQEKGLSTLYSTMSESYMRVEDIFNEPSDNGLNSMFDNFFNAWEDLSNDPESNSTDRKSTRLNSSHVKISYAV